MNKNGTTITYRLGEVEKKVSELDGKVDIMLQNHIPHLHEEISGIRTRVNILTAVNIGGVILALIINKFL